MERICQPEEFIVPREMVKANHLFIYMRDLIQTNVGFAPKNYQNQPFLKLKKEVGFYMLTKLLF